RHTRFSRDWSSDVCSSDLLNTYTSRTPGAFIEEKSFSLVWHFRKTPKALGEHRASELINNLGYLTRDRGLQLLQGNKVIEIKNRSEERRVGKENRAERTAE